MKKTKKITGGVRVATYINKDLFQWLTKKATDMGLNESALIRMLIVKERQVDNEKA